MWFWYFLVARGGIELGPRITDPTQPTYTEPIQGSRQLM